MKCAECRPADPQQVQAQLASGVRQEGATGGHDIHRQGRLHVPHATYFVVNRFRRELEVLAADPRRSHQRADEHRLAANRRHFEAILEYLSRRWCTRVHAYCWLPDSALLLIQIAQVSLECAMHSLRESFSHFFRTQAGRPARLYGERYRALLIDPEEYLLDFVRHIFWSPVHARLCRTPLAYEWSNARVCVGEPAPSFLYTRTLAQALASRGFGSRTLFMTFLATRPTPGFVSLLPHGSRHDHRIAGGAAFVREVRQQSLVVTRRVDLDLLISWVSERLDVASDRIVGESRFHLPVQARALVAWIASCAGSASLPELAARLSCSPSSLHRAISRYLRIRPALFSYETLKAFEESVRESGKAS